MTIQEHLQIAIERLRLGRYAKNLLWLGSNRAEAFSIIEELNGTVGGLGVKAASLWVSKFSFSSLELPQVLVGAVGQAGKLAKSENTVLALFAENLHSLSKTQLAILLETLHSCAQKSLPVLLIATGLPSLTKKLGAAKPYAERMFDIFPAKRP